eukprot:CAMPEP_0117511226 /NCGR_PEP_ID=MMETSP0784-20121206/28397_1 /TAXON_ID=39447 /ORGANISM="" /LENGTH=428 /DNA_ID=CAMNT_0005306889 /DNA_START=135 /DNA_END=1421 /DNA_ORIENTATION=+
MGCITKADLIEWFGGVSKGLMKFFEEQLARNSGLTPMSCLQWRGYDTAADQQNTGLQFLAHLFVFANRSFDAAFKASGFEQRCVTSMDLLFYCLLAALMNPPVPDWATHYLLHCRSLACFGSWYNEACASCGSPSILFALDCGHNITERLPNYQNGSPCNALPSDDVTHVRNLERGIPIELVLLVLTAMFLCVLFAVILIRVRCHARKHQAEVNMLRSCLDAWTFCSWTLEAPPGSLDPKFAACLGCDASEGFCLFDWLREEDRSRLREVLANLKLSDTVPSKISVTLWNANLREPDPASLNKVDLTLLAVSRKCVLVGVNRSTELPAVPPPEHIGRRVARVLATESVFDTENASGRFGEAASNRSFRLNDADDIVSAPSDVVTLHSASALDASGQVTGVYSAMQMARFNRHLLMGLERLSHVSGADA